MKTGKPYFEVCTNLANETEEEQTQKLIFVLYIGDVAVRLLFTNAWFEPHVNTGRYFLLYMYLSVSANAAYTSVPTRKRL